MEQSANSKFSFKSKALPEETFTVVKFRGVEGLSQCYYFEIDLASTSPDLDMDLVIGNPASFIIKRDDGDIPFHGILTRFELHQAYKEHVFYKAVLQPRLAWLQNTHHNQVFLEKNTPDIISAVLEDSGLTSLDFELRLEKSYDQWDFVCQYQESHFDFISRWMEREGMYYFFEQDGPSEKLIVADSLDVHQKTPLGETIQYAPPSGLEDAHQEEIITSLFCRQKRLPKKVTLKDYNYRTPSMKVAGQAEVTDAGLGEFYYYGDHIRTPEEGRRLADIRSESFLCREKLFIGQSTIPFLMSGYIFDLQGHFRPEFNREHLIIEVAHEGSQAAYLTAGLEPENAGDDQETHYRNEFQAIPRTIQFRAEHKTPKARLFGTMNAHIDAEGSGKYAELDEHGRYKVVLPFDLSGRKDGKASARIRMMQPYGGADHGQHFPLHKGVEVLLTFIDGDPDRPVIAGTVPNPEYPSQVDSSTQTQCRITTGGQNQIHLEDAHGTERMLLKTPHKNTWFRMGAPNDPPSASLLPRTGFHENDSPGQPALRVVGSDEKSGSKDGDLNKGWKKDDHGTGPSYTRHDKAGSSVQSAEHEAKSFEGGFMFSSEGSLNGIVNANYSLEVGGIANKVVLGAMENEFFAGDKNDVVMGLMSETFVGGKVGTVLGAVSELFGGAKVETTVGGVLDIVLALVQEVKPNFIKTMEQKLHITNLGTEIAENKTDIAENKELIHDTKTEILEECTRLGESQDEIYNDLVKMVSEAVKILQSEIKTVDEKVQTCATKTELNEEVTRINETVTNVEEEVTQVRGTVTSVSDEVTKVADDLALLVEGIEFFATLVVYA